MALTLSQTFFSVVLADTASGKIQVMLQDVRGQAVAGQLVRFMVEGSPSVTSCTTNAAGTCTILLEAVPADHSGFIRGTLEVVGHGTRPLIWPAGELDLALTVGVEGGIQPPVDVLATRAPTSVPPALPTATLAPTLHLTETASAEGSTPLSPDRTATIAPPSQNILTASSRRHGNWWGPALVFGLLLTLRIAADFYTTRRKGVDQ